MDLDDELDDAPPLLVIDDGNPRAETPTGLEAEMEDLSITKVPITIVTGRSRLLLSCSYHLLEWKHMKSMIQLPSLRSWTVL